MRKLLKIVGILVGLIVVASIGVFSYFGFTFFNAFPVIGSSSKPLHLVQFYRMQVSLTHVPDNKPVDINLVIGCGGRYQQSGGDGVSAYYVRVPNIYGIALETGEGVLVQTPDICDEVPEEVVPPDFLPLVLYAPDAKDLEFMIAYVSENAYEQKFSKLRFHKATITRSTKEDYEAWKQSGTKNITPSRKDAKGQPLNFYSKNFHSPDDIRNRGQFLCRSLIRIPIPADMKEQFRALWPNDRPRFWIPDMTRNEFRPLFDAALNRDGDGPLAGGLWGKDRGGAYGYPDQVGISRRSGQGSLIDAWNPIYFGEADRIPFRTNTGYPWLSDEIKSETLPPNVERHALRPRPASELYLDPPESFDYHINLVDGADKGFAYCYRDVWAAFGDRTTTDKIDQHEWFRAYKRTLYVDGKLEIPDATHFVGFINVLLIERDAFMIYKSRLRLDSRYARQE